MAQAKVDMKEERILTLISFLTYLDQNYILLQRPRPKTSFDKGATKEQINSIAKRFVESESKSRYQLPRSKVNDL